MGGGTLQTGLHPWVRAGGWGLDQEMGTVPIESEFKNQLSSFRTVLARRPNGGVL